MKCSKARELVSPYVDKELGAPEKRAFEVAALRSLQPALKASRIEPITALRYIQEDLMKCITVLVILSVSLLALPLFAEENQQTGNIAVASTGKILGSPVADRMGRAPFYLVFSREGTFLKAIENPNFGKRQGPAGVSAIDSIGFDEKGVMTGGIAAPSQEERQQIWNGFTDFFARNGITIVVAEEFGDEIVRGMKAGGIECVLYKGSSDEAVRSVVGKLQN